MTKSNILGYVAAFPIPEVIRGINAFTLGAQAMNPNVQVRVVWTKTWYDPALEKEGAKSLLDVGTDVIAMHQDSPPGPQVAAEEKGVYSVGYNTDMSSFAPNAHLTAPVWNWAVIYEYVTKAVEDGTWASEDICWGLDKGVVDLAPFGPMVPQEVRDKVLAKKEEIKSGQTDVFVGPVFDQKGEVRIPEGSRATEEEMLSMDWFVRGVVGTTQ